jgi:hypothetical protein
MTPTPKRKLKRRNAIEQIIGSADKLKKIFNEPNVAYILADCRV